MAPDLYVVPYELFLKHGCVWCPNWYKEQRGFGWNLVVAPPGMTTIPSAAIYYGLLTRRIEFHIIDWVENYASEMAIADIDDSNQRIIATLQLIHQALPRDLTRSMTGQSFRDIANALSRTLRQEFPHQVFPNGIPSFPVPLLNRQESADFTDCIRSEMTLSGWLTDAFDRSI